MTESVLLLNAAREVVGPLTPESFKTRRKYAGVSSMSMSLARRTLYGEQVLTGAFLYLPDGNEVYQVEVVETVATGSPLNTGLTASGRSIEGFALEERVVLPPLGFAYDEFSGPAESAIKHYVNTHAGADAAAERQIPNFVVAADAARGVTVHVNGRFQTVGKVLAQIAATSGMGWGTVYDPDAREFVFDIIEGRDLTDSVFFDFDFQTLEQWVEVQSIADSKTFVVVAGQGEGVDRDIVYRWGALSEPEGFERREAFVDARDIEQGETDLLDERGDAAIAELSPERSLEARVHPYGSFKYRIDWLEGDTVTLHDEAADVMFTSRVIEVDRTWDDSLAAPKIDTVLDRAIPSVKDRVTIAATRGGTIVDYAVGGAAAIALVVATMSGVTYMLTVGGAAGLVIT